MWIIIYQSNISRTENINLSQISNSISETASKVHSQVKTKIVSELPRQIESAKNFKKCQNSEAIFILYQGISLNCPSVLEEDLLSKYFEEK